MTVKGDLTVYEVEEALKVAQGEVERLKSEVSGGLVAQMIWVSKATARQETLTAANTRAERLREALTWCYEECREVRLCGDITFGGKTIKALADDAKEEM